MTLSCLEMQKMPRVFVMHTETEILQKKKSVPVQAGFLNWSVSWHRIVTSSMPDIIARHPEIPWDCSRIFYKSGSVCTGQYFCAEMFPRRSFWGTCHRKNKYEAIQGLPKKAYPEFSQGRPFCCGNLWRRGSAPDPVRRPQHSCIRWKTASLITARYSSG